MVDVDVKQSLGYVFDAISLTRHRLDGQCPLIGFTGAPVSVQMVLLISISYHIFCLTSEPLTTIFSPPHLVKDFCCTVLCIRTAYAVARCPSVCPSVRPSVYQFVYSVETNKCIFKFLHYRVATPFQFLHTKLYLWRYFEEDPANRGIKCRRGMQKSPILRQ